MPAIVADGVTDSRRLVPDGSFKQKPPEPDQQFKSSSPRQFHLERWRRVIDHECGSIYEGGIFLFALD